MVEGKVVGFPSLASACTVVWQAVGRGAKRQDTNAVQVNTCPVATQPEGGTSCTPDFQAMLCAGCLFCMREHVHTTTLGAWLGRFCGLIHTDVDIGLSRQ